MKFKIITLVILLFIQTPALFTQSSKIPDTISIAQQSDEVDDSSAKESNNNKTHSSKPWWQWVIFIGLLIYIFILFMKKFMNYRFHKIKQQNHLSQSYFSTKGNNAMQLINSAFNEIDRKNYEKARELLEESFKLNNQIPEGHSEYAFVMTILGYRDRAIDHMIKAAMLKPKDAKFWSNLAFQYYNDKQYIKAMTATYLAEIVNPNYRSISESKRMIEQEFTSFNSNKETCKRRATELWEVLNNPTDGLPIQSGDINQLLDPNITFFL